MISWIKLDVNILDDAKIKIIRSHPDGNSIVLLWIGLLCLAMKSARPGIIEISNGLPYTVDDLASAFSIEKKTVELGLMLFKKYQMIDIFDGDTIEVINFAKHQSIEELERKRELTRARVSRYREKLKCNALLTQDSRDVTLTDKIRQDKIRKEKTYCQTSDEVRLSELLFNKIKTRNPGFNQPNIQKWAGYVDRLIRIDKKTPVEIEQVIEWCQHDLFWQNNILSTDKLRKQYDALNTKRLSGGNGNAGTTTSFRDKRNPGLSPEQEREADAINAEYYRRKALEAANQTTGNA